jgi:hypothetical protein
MVRHEAGPGRSQFRFELPRKDFKLTTQSDVMRRVHARYQHGRTDVVEQLNQVQKN